MQRAVRIANRRHSHPGVMPTQQSWVPSKLKLGLEIAAHGMADRDVDVGGRGWIGTFVMSRHYGVELIAAGMICQGSPLQIAAGPCLVSYDRSVHSIPIGLQSME